LTSTKLTKRCAKCHAIKDLTQFTLEKRNKDGHYSYCKICCRERINTWRVKHPKENKEGQHNFYINHMEKKKEAGSKIHLS
jgi:hypothetical protein